jgi:TonB-linked SusC/RagA family outer membrane protein
MKKVYNSSWLLKPIVSFHRFPQLVKILTLFLICELALPVYSHTPGNISADPQQQIRVTGKITDVATGQAMPGVNIQVKGTSIGAIGDIEGNYSLTVTDRNATLVFSFIGYVTQEISLNGRTTLNVTLTGEVKGLEEVIVIGYGTQKKSSINGAITTMEGDRVQSVPVAILSNALAGRISGVTVNQASGAPGYAANIYIRSINTWKTTGTDPLYVIDGIISTKQNFDGLDASEIKSLTVLKDAASSAVYGARGSNGVILVTTNTGSEGKLKLTYSYEYNFERPSNLPEYVGAKDMVRLENYAYTGVGLDPKYGPQEVAYFNEHDPARSLFDDIYRNPTSQKHTVSATGGSDKIKYFVGGSSIYQSAFVDNADYKRYNLRSNINVKFTNNLSGVFNISYHQSTKRRFVMQEDNLANFEEDDTFGKFWSRIQYLQPHAPAKTSDGKLINPGWIGNAMGFVEQGGMNTRLEYNINTLMSLRYNVPFINGLSISGNYSPQFYIKDIKHYEKKMTLYNVEQQGEHGYIYTDNVISSTLSSYPSKERLAKTHDRNKQYQLNFSADYSKSFGMHNISAMFNVEISEGSDDYFYLVRENFPLLQRDQFWATGSSRNDSYGDGTEYQSGRMSYIGRLIYQYSDKYFMNATLRRDGSMLFAPNYRWGNFPSVSLGWVISKENFFHIPLIDFLKLRGTWGLAGNDVVGGWKWQESYSTNGSFMIGTVMQPRVAYNGIVNDKLTWEKTSEYNIGLDSRFLGGVVFNFEYFHRHNYDILDSRIVSLPAEFGGTMPPVNYGIVDGQGFEMELGYNGRAGELNYEVKGNLSYATNKVIVRDVPQNVRDVNNPIGRSTDYVACLVSTGIIRTQAELNAIPAGYTIYGLKPTLGSINFEDVSGLTPGVPDGKIDDYDRQVIKGKHYLPPYSYGLELKGEWKGIMVDVFFQGFLGVSKMYDDDYAYHRRFYDARPPSVWLNAWSEDNPGAPWPKPVPWGYTSDWVESTFWLKNAAYLRLGHLNISYSLPKSIIERLNISNVSFVVSGTNLFTLSGFKWYDPSIPSMSSYPTMKSYTFGINVTL